MKVFLYLRRLFLMAKTCFQEKGYLLKVMVSGGGRPSLLPKTFTSNGISESGQVNDQNLLFLNPFSDIIIVDG